MNHFTNYFTKLVVLAGIAGITLAVVPTAGHAQSTSETLAQRQLAQRQQGQRQQPQGLPPIFDSIDLTPEQTTAIEDIMASSRQEVMGVFSQEQIQARQQTMAAGGTPEEAMAAMNLSQEQTAQLQDIRSQRAEKIMEILTEEQQVQLQDALRQQAQGQRPM